MPEFTSNTKEPFMKQFTFKTGLSLVVVAVLIGSITSSTFSHSCKSHGKTVTLFNGKNFDGWTCDLGGKNPPKMEDVWSVKEGGVLFCKGRPAGVFRTKKEYSNYTLELEWRWPGKGGNNGVLVHCGKPRVLGIWPRSLEVQLHSGNAGDFWDIGTECDVPNEHKRRRGRNVKNLTDDSEKPLGEWNHYKIICKDDTCTVYVNGTLVNQCTNMKDKETGEKLTSGAISLQSEGREIEYRNIKLTPLK